MKRTILFVLLIFAENIFSQNVSPQFSELKGMEDQSGNTHLFYRIYSYTVDSITANFYIYNDIYHFDLLSMIDTVYIEDYRYSDLSGIHNKNVQDYDIWHKNTNHFIYCGITGGDPDFTSLIERFDGYSTYNYLSTFVTDIAISKQDDSLVFAGVFPSPWITNDRTIVSTNGGWNWNSISDAYTFRSLSPFFDNVLFAQSPDKLYRSEDQGLTFNLVDNLRSLNDKQFLYDKDSDHIYRVAFNLPEYQLRVSSNNGDPFSWEVRFLDTNRILISIDDSISGTIYLANKKNIYLSTDYGENFNLYKHFDRNIVGIYKKPNSNKLYAATKYKIYEITPDSIQVIKNLPIPPEAFDWYPLQIGNKWIYHNTFYDDVGDSTRWISISEVVSQKIIENQVYQEVLVKEIPIDSSGNSGTHYEYFRVDSADAKVFRDWFEKDTLLLEELYMDLIVEVGDTIPVGNGIYLDSEEPVNLFGLNSTKRTFFHVITPARHLELVNGIGKTYEYIWELVGVENILKGCIINGVVYGDTTVVSVEDETQNFPTEFSLSQNYPNPFNPTTKIRYTIPSVILSEAKNLVTLKVYDVLGNKIATLVNEEKPAGEHEVEFSARGGLASGIYFYQLRAGSFIQTKKMILLR